MQKPISRPLTLLSLGPTKQASLPVRKEIPQVDLYFKSFLSSPLFFCSLWCQQSRNLLAILRGSRESIPSCLFRSCHPPKVHAWHMHCPSFVASFMYILVSCIWTKTPVLTMIPRGLYLPVLLHLHFEEFLTSRAHLIQPVGLQHHFLHQFMDPTCRRLYPLWDQAKESTFPIFPHRILDPAWKVPMTSWVSPFLQCQENLEQQVQALHALVLMNRLAQWRKKLHLPSENQKETNFTSHTERKLWHNQRSRSLIKRLEQYWKSYLHLQKCSLLLALNSTVMCGAHRRIKLLLPAQMKMKVTVLRLSTVAQVQTWRQGTNLTLVWPFPFPYTLILASFVTVDSPCLFL